MRAQSRMTWIARKPFTVFARGTSLRRRVAYSLGLVRLILVPVIFLAVYYLFAMGSIVDRIVSVDAPMATLAERISLEMLDARRAERNYFLVYDPAELEANHQALSRMQQIIDSCRQLQPEESSALGHIKSQGQFYQRRMADAVARRGEVTEAPAQHLRGVIRAYTRDLNELLKGASHTNRTRLVEELHNRVGSLDEQVAETLEAEDPAFHQISADLRTSSDAIERESSDLESRSWERVERDHERARLLVRQVFLPLELLHEQALPRKWVAGFPPVDHQGVCVMWRPRDKDELPLLPVVVSEGPDAAVEVEQGPLPP